MAGFWTDARIREALRLEPAPASIDVSFSGIATDTRALQHGAVFVALRGERFDAHEFLRAAAEAGATAAIVSRLPADAPADLVCFQVTDTLVALGDLARYYRRHLGAAVCAIAGTNGKTTTKNMTRAVLGTRYRVHATGGNFNNLIGAPLTILAAPADTEALVVELGTNTPGEIARLRDIVEPDAVVLTRLAEEHLEGLGDLQGVLREESSLLEGLPDSGVAVVSDDPPELAERARALAQRVHVAGLSDRADADLRAENVELDEEGRARFRWEGRPVHLSLRGRFNAANAMLALGLGRSWGVEPDAAIAAISRLEPEKMRAEVKHVGRMRVIVDCYNSNPASLHGAIDLLMSMPRGDGRVAIIGSMLELGPTSARIHADAAAEIARQDIDLIVATGDFVAALAPHVETLGDRLLAVPEVTDVFPRLQKRLRGGEVVLLKGSRGVRLERILEAMTAHAGDSAGAH